MGNAMMMRRGSGGGVGIEVLVAATANALPYVPGIPRHMVGVVTGKPVSTIVISSTPPAQTYPGLLFLKVGEGRTPILTKHGTFLFLEYGRVYDAGGSEFVGIYARSPNNQWVYNGMSIWTRYYDTSDTLLALGAFRTGDGLQYSIRNRVYKEGNMLDISRKTAVEEETSQALFVPDKIDLTGAFMIWVEVSSLPVQDLNFEETMLCVSTEPFDTGLSEPIVAKTVLSQAKVSLPVASMDHPLSGSYYVGLKIGFKPSAVYGSIVLRNFTII